MYLSNGLTGCHYRSHQVPKRKTVKKIKRKTVSQLKDQLWPLFSKWIKLTYSDDGRWCKCFTCDAPIEIGATNCQGGHFIPKGGYEAHRFSIDNVRPQCFRCNHNLEGNTEAFRRRLIDEIGAARVEALWATRKEVKQLRQDWYTKMITFYTEDIKRLEDSF